MNIKKQFVELVELLQANDTKKVSTIMPAILELVTSGQATRNFVTNEAGEVTHIFCYYHKKWETLTEVEYGHKKHSASGFNSMCKEGVNNWSKQQRNYKKGRSELLDLVASGELPADQLTERMNELELDKNYIVPRADGFGSDTLE